MKRIILSALIALAPASVLAAGVISKTEVFAERIVPQPKGPAKVVLEVRRSMAPGTHIVVQTTTTNQVGKPISDLVINAPVPASEEFEAVLDPGAVVSADGGKSFGALASLRVPNGAGPARAALPSDVTNVRWIVKGPILNGASSKLRFRARVK